MARVHWQETAFGRRIRRARLHRRVRRALRVGLALLVAAAGAGATLLPEGSVERQVAQGIHAVGGAVREVIETVPPERKKP